MDSNMREVKNYMQELGFADAKIEFEKNKEIEKKYRAEIDTTIIEMENDLRNDLEAFGFNFAMEEKALKDMLKDEGYTEEQLSYILHIGCVNWYVPSFLTTYKKLVNQLK